MRTAFLLPAIFILLSAMPAFAHCPACSFATGAVVASARLYGLDDLIVGTLLGAFLLSSAFWVNNFLVKKNKGKNHVPFQSLVITLIVLASSLVGFSEIIKSSPEIFGFNKILFGIFIGTFTSLLAYEFHRALRDFNNGKNYVPMQIIFVTLLFLAVFSAAFYYMGFI